jgi:hypothetical protein
MRFGGVPAVYFVKVEMNGATTLLPVAAALMLPERTGEVSKEVMLR